MSANLGDTGITLSQVLRLVVITAIAIALERIITTYLSRFAKRAKLERNAANNLVLTFRILILAGAVLAIAEFVAAVSPTLILSISAVIGAAVGFASQKTLGNFIAGLFLLAAKPFRVGDYVRLGTVEGIVQEVTLNYTKVLTIGNNTISVSNLQILDRDITNFVYESRRHFSIYCYTFDIGFDHSISTDKLAEIFDEVFERFTHTLPKKPSAMLKSSDAFARVFTVYLYVEHPEDVFTLRPQVSEEIFKRWDVERSAKSKLSKEEQTKKGQDDMKTREEKVNEKQETRRKSNPTA
ncbi:MAG: mechanosensitive ion channel family protein [Chloroflexota bacterium]